MPSPLVHGTMGYVIYRIVRPRMPEKEAWRVGPLPGLMVVTVALSLLPDVDAVYGILMGDLGRYHNNVINSLLVGVMVAVGAGAVGWAWTQGKFWVWFIIALVCYEIHIIMDLFTVGRGVMILWPFSGSRYESAVKVFYGLHWSDGWMSIRHLWTILTELPFVVCVGISVHVLTKQKHPKTSRLAASTTSEVGKKLAQ